MSWVDILVFYAFLIFDLANRASFLVYVGHELSVDVVIFYMHFGNVTPECSKPRQPKNA